MYSASGNKTLDILFYKKEIEIENAFRPFWPKSSVAFTVVQYTCILYFLWLFISSDYFVNECHLLNLVISNP